MLLLHAVACSGTTRLPYILCVRQLIMLSLSLFLQWDILCGVPLSSPVGQRRRGQREESGERESVSSPTRSCACGLQEDQEWRYILSSLFTDDCSLHVPNPPPPSLPSVVQFGYRSVFPVSLVGQTTRQWWHDVLVFSVYFRPPTDRSVCTVHA